MSAIANEFSDSVLNNAKSVLAIGSEEAVVELVSLHCLMHQSAVPDHNDHPAETTAQGAPLQLVPTEPVIFSPPVASTDKLVHSMAGQMSSSINRCSSEPGSLLWCQGSSQSVLGAFDLV